jgi:hypothetical protein
MKVIVKRGNSTYSMGLEILTPMTIKGTVFSGVRSGTLVEVNGDFGRSYRSAFCWIGLVF